MAEWTLADATQIRENLTKEQEDEISMLYRKVYLQVRKQMLAIPKDGTTSQQIQRQYLDKLHKQLDEAYKSLGVGLEKQIEKGAKKAAQGVVDDSAKFFTKAGLTLEGAYSFVPKEIVASIATGKLYGGDWSLSGAIWSDIRKKQADINTIIAEGLAANKSAYDIAKDLETYVDPKAKKEWDWSKVYPGTSKKVDYNAQRLARTMVSHAYQQSLERVCKNNPFVTGYIWQSAHSRRVCPICAGRDGQFYKKGELPLDHPNGMCTFIAEIEGSMKYVGERLGDWVNGKADPELDSWFNEMIGSKSAVSKLKANSNRETDTLYGIMDAPVRPKKSDYSSDEDYEKARKKYRADKEMFNEQISQWVSKQLVNPMTREEIDAWATKAGVTIADIDGLDLRAMTSYTKRFDELSNKYKIVKQYLSEIGGKFEINYSSREYYQAEASRGFSFGPIFKHYDEALREIAESRVGGKDFVRGDGTINVLFDHEFGHQLYFAIRGAGTDRWEKTRGMREDLIKSTVGKEGSSDYSNTNDNELFAEGFAAWNGGEDTEFAKSFGDFLSRWLK